MASGVLLDESGCSSSSFHAGLRGDGGARRRGAQQKQHQREKPSAIASRTCGGAMCEARVSMAAPGERRKMQLQIRNKRPRAAGVRAMIITVLR